MHPQPRMMIMAGGTGGHVFPALAVANALRDKGTAVTWLGTKRGIESRLVPANDFAIEWISVQGLRGSGVLSWLLAPFKLIRAVWQSIVVIRQVNPDCILGMGGFVSGPGGLAARLLGKPLVVHEQNAVAGLTNRYLAKIANKVLSGFADVAGLPSSALWVGNPVRNTIKPKAGSAPEDAHEPIKILVIGGSQGARSFNQKLATVFASQTVPLRVWHQSGKGQAAAVEQTYINTDQSIDVKVSDFIDDMSGAYDWADLLICRSGAMTVAEACAAGKPALFIPYPFSAGDHQVKNAQAMVAVGAAKMLGNEQLVEPVMVTTLAELLESREKLIAMGRAAHSLHKPQALNCVVEVCEEYLHAQ